MTIFGSRPAAATCFVAALLVSAVALHGAAQQEPQGRGRGRTPPQPQQKPGAEYFVGTWTFTATGRESSVSLGPRQGTTTFTLKSPTVVTYTTEGKADDTGKTFKETGTAEWDDAKKSMSFKETLFNGTSLTGTGDWSSPLSIRYESQPVKIGGETVRVRRVYSILAAHSFSIAEEISIDGGPFQRLGNAVYSKR